MDKRTFIKSLGALTALTYIGPVSALSEPAKKKKMLMLGGRGYLGPTIVNTFLKANYEVTLINRGITNPDMFTELPIIICDREKEEMEGLKAIEDQIKDKHWDVVVDTWQKSPKAVADFLEVFKGKFNHYHYVSSIAVYKNWRQGSISEIDELKDLPEFPTTIEKEFPYSIRKALSEKAIQKHGIDYTIHRSHGMRAYRTPEPIYEPYWPVKFMRGEEIVLPLQDNHYMQVTDVVSYCKFILHCSKKKTTGIFNVARDRMLFNDYVDDLIKVTGKPKKMHWIPAKFLTDNEIIPYRSLPLWRPEPEGFYNINTSKAKAAGLRNRPLVRMLWDQLSGYKFRYPKDGFKFGGRGTISREKELDILKKWLESKKS